ncbi:hypothetical protein QBC40DRAFT_186748 [Triangularia verruculosa]|uniref:Uncharacterized protein n=1 Tax=Triangularia verruculosa TaxID=2587418 RepID=A0AAN6X8Q1_9PEZI|nr:hypothetical protein QBC40DRAFT_186748 [Triangularia verruculosa]
MPDPRAPIITGAPEVHHIFNRQGVASSTIDEAYLSSLTSRNSVCSSLFSSWVAASPTTPPIVSSWLVSSFRDLQSTGSFVTITSPQTIDWEDYCSREQEFATTRSVPDGEVASAYTGYLTSYENWKSQSDVQSQGYAIATRCAGVGRMAGNILRQIATNIDQCKTANEIWAGGSTLNTAINSTISAAPTQTESEATTATTEAAETETGQDPETTTTSISTAGARQTKISHVVAVAGVAAFGAVGVVV